MAFEKGQAKPEGSGRKPGRPKGSLGWRQRQARDLMERLGYDPLEALLRICRNARLPLETRIDAMKAALPFVYPRLATTHVVGRLEHDVVARHALTAMIESPDPATQTALAQLERLYLQTLQASDAELAGVVLDVPTLEAGTLPEPEG